ncbi:MAG: nucleotide-binding protein [Acidobacteria bacterium]|nr:nucleotide-binding protein [Acidobacteriota bacterium]
MVTRSKVFIASSSEGLDVTTAIRRSLLSELDQIAEVEPWTREFELSATYIESLEKIVAQADFAVLVLTPDDVTTSRKKEKLSPRDNVIFELGLFMGGLGRERCYLVQEDRPDLKLPSDLLGVKSATFKRPEDGDLKAPLDAKCALIAERIIKLGVRHKLSPDAGAAQAAMRAFFDRLKGAWWQRITMEGTHWLSFFQIELDDLYNSVQLRGSSYDAEGSPIAHWSSVVARVSKEERKIVYLWQGWYPESSNFSPQDRFHGFGEMEFEVSREASDPIIRGQGRFWDVDETHPARTVVKVVQLRRVADKSDILAMTSGKDKDLRSVVVRTFPDW